MRTYMGKKKQAKDETRLNAQSQSTRYREGIICENSNVTVYDNVAYISPLTTASISRRVIGLPSIIL